MADEFVELHGDQVFGDDEAVVAGFAMIGGHRVAVIGQQKGADTEENLRRSFGMPHPEGYRKAMRVMELAERSGLPAFVDVPGAHPGPSPRSAIAEAIARSIGLMTRLRTPIVTVITGDGGSEGHSRSPWATWCWPWRTPSTPIFRGLREHPLAHDRRGADRRPGDEDERHRPAGPGCRG